MLEIYFQSRPGAIGGDSNITDKRIRPTSNFEPATGSAASPRRGRPRPSAADRRRLAVRQPRRSRSVSSDGCGAAEPADEEQRGLPR
jgi:hypothetical protein